LWLPAVCLLDSPGARNDHPGGMGNQTSSTHALTGPPTALLPIAVTIEEPAPYACEPPCLSDGQTRRDDGRRDGADQLDRHRAIGAGAASARGSACRMAGRGRWGRQNAGLVLWSAGLRP